MEFVITMLPRILILALVMSMSLLWSPQQASAQILEEDDSSYVYKGFFMSAEYGLYIFALKPDSLIPNADTGRGASADLLGSVSGFDLGFDLNEMFALQFSFGTVNVRGGTQDGGGSTAMLFNGGVSIFFLRSRLTFYARVGAGLAVTMPTGILPIGLMAHLGLGVRYFTRMKHFSISFEARGLFRPPLGDNSQGNTMSLGIGLLPSVTYTF